MKHKCLWFLIFFLPLLSGCSLPGIQPLSVSRNADITKNCERLFLRSPWQLVHSIHTVLPNDEKQHLIGITIIFPESRLIKCVIMTIEGIVLLDAEYQNEIEINRAIPPFDKMAFARSIFEYLEISFLPPDGRIMETGKTDSGLPVCRYERKDKSILDVIHPGKRNVEFQHYSRFSNHLQTIRLMYEPDNPEKTFTKKAPLPSEIKISNHGMLKYSLHLDLLEAKALATESF